MFAFLLLVAIFSFASPFEAEAQQHPFKCKEDTVQKIYAYWRENGGVPKYIIEHNIRCHPREIPYLSTPQFFDENVKCAVMDHFARYNTIHYLKDNCVSDTHTFETYEWNGKEIDPLRENIRFQIAESGGARLLHLCTLRQDAEEGSDQFVIRGVEGAATEEGIKTMQDLLVNTFGCAETLRSYPETCRLPNETPHPVEHHCANSSCTHHEH